MVRRVNEIERLRLEVRKLVLQIRELHHNVFEKEVDASLLSAKSVTNSDKCIVKLSNRSIRILYVLQKKV